MSATGRFGRPFWSSRTQVGLAEVRPSVAIHRRPSSVPAYTAVPPPTPIALTRHPRAPFGAVPVQPLVRSPLIGFHLTSPADGVRALSVRYTRYVPSRSWFGFILFIVKGV